MLPAISASPRSPTKSKKVCLRNEHGKFVTTRIDGQLLTDTDVLDSTGKFEMHYCDESKAVMLKSAYGKYIVSQGGYLTATGDASGMKLLLSRNEDRTTCLKTDTGEYLVVDDGCVRTSASSGLKLQVEGLGNRRTQYTPRSVNPRRELDLDALRSAKLQRGCMSERHLDGPGVLRLMRFAPTTLAPGTVFKVLNSSRSARLDDFQQKRSRSQPPDHMQQLREEVHLWQRSTYNWLAECARQGEHFAALSDDLEDWISRAEAIMPADGSAAAAAVGVPPLSVDLVSSAKKVLAKKVESERQEKYEKLHGVTRRLYRTRDSESNSQQPAVMKTRSGGLANASEFRAVLERSYGDLLTAWDHLDSNFNAQLDWHEFASACFKLHIGGCLRQIFNEMAKNKLSIKLTDLDPSLHAEQERREQEMRQKQQERVAAREKMRLPLLQGVAPLPLELGEGEGAFDQDCIRQWSKERMPDQRRASASGSTPSSKSSGRNSGTRRLSTTGEVVYALTHGSESSFAFNVVDAKGFAQAIARKYQTLEAGWDDLDKNGDGILCFQEFVMGCRKLQLCGNMKQMFQDFSSDASRGLKMSDLDPAMRDEQERREKAYLGFKREQRDSIQEQQSQAQALWRHNAAPKSARSNKAADPMQDSFANHSFASSPRDLLPAISDGQ